MYSVYNTYCSHQQLNEGTKTYDTQNYTAIVLSGKNTHSGIYLCNVISYLDIYRIHISTNRILSQLFFLF